MLLFLLIIGLTHGIRNNIVSNVNSRKNYTPVRNNKLNINSLESGSIRTWSYKSYDISRVQVNLKSNGRPLDASIELWNGPNNSPSKMRVYLQDGYKYHFNTVIETPNFSNTVAIKNIGAVEFPLSTHVRSYNIDLPTNDCFDNLVNIQGDSLKTFIVDSQVKRVQILITTDGRPIDSRIELVQGPNNNKQVIEIYNDDGYIRPFYCILDTPDSSNVIRIINKSPIEFPISASVNSN